MSSFPLQKRQRSIFVDFSNLREISSQVDQARHGTDLDGSGEAEGDVGPMGAGDDLYSKINHEAKHRSRKKKAPSAPDAAP